MATVPTADRTTITDSLRQKLDRYLESEIERASFPGAVYAVGDSSGIVLQNALG